MSMPYKPTPYESMPFDVDHQGLAELVEARFKESMTVPEIFFAAETERIAQACWAMARRFHAGGRLLAFGNGAWATDAQHVSVEFVHPVIVGKRALPALALTNDSAALSALNASCASGVPFARQIKLLSRPNDIAMGFSPDGRCANVLGALREARGCGLLTLGLCGRSRALEEEDGRLAEDGGGAMARAGLDFCFTVPSDDPMVVQETHETLYHVLWELVHVFFEHEGLLA